VVEIHPANETAATGEQVEFTCMTVTESQDEHGVTWLFVKIGTVSRKTICTGVSVSVEVRGKYECSNEINRHTLIVKNVHVNDSGIYTCIEDGGRGPGTNSSTLTVVRKLLNSYRASVSIVERDIDLSLLFVRLSVCPTPNESTYRHILTIW